MVKLPACSALVSIAAFDHAEEHCACSHSHPDYDYAVWSALGSYQLALHLCRLLNLIT